MYKRILVPLDGSPTAKAGFDEAIKLAKDQSAELCLLHVLDNRALMESVGVGVDAAAIDRMIESTRNDGIKLLAKAEAQVRKLRVPVKTLLIENNGRDIASVIAAQARKWRADLIVIGTHGRQGVSRLLMGSDAESVAREVKVPVLLVHSKSRKS